MSPDERAEPYAQIAAQWAGKVREDDPEAVRRWVVYAVHDLAARHGPVTGEAVINALFTVGQMLAAAVPNDIEWLALTEWTVRREGWDVKPHGTLAALRRHQYHNEPPCALCRAYGSGYRAGRYGRKSAGETAKEAAA